MSDSEIFKAAAKLPPDRRQEYLDQACGANHELRREVESLLREHDTSDSFLERPAAERIPTHAFDSAFGETVKDAEYALDFLAPSEKPDCLGKVGQYEISEVVGRGGMGIVLKGYDPKLSRVVAVKVLAPELASNASARKRFLREGRAAAAVSHDHVVTIYGIDDGGPLPFIAMEYVSGPSLEGRIKDEGSLELTEILRIGMQIASGLAAAHAQGLVHRDVKPANILLENGVEKVKITDFGLARAVDDVRMTKPGVVTGTPEYMSPEQARGESVDHRTDLFSLGSVMYAMCTGRSPFRAENTVAMIRRVCEDTPRPIEDVNPEIPGWLIQIIDDLLVKSAADRFQSASELAELLGQCLAHLQEPSVNPLPERLEGYKGARVARQRATTRRRGWLAAAAVLLLGLGGLSVTEATGVTNVAGTVIRIVRGDGTLVIHVDDPEVSVSIDGEELVITGAGAKEIRLAVGQHELRAVKDGKPLYTELVTITRDGREVVNVAREKRTPAVRSAKQVTTRLVWSIGADLGGGKPSPDGRYLTFVDHHTGDVGLRELSTGKSRLLTQTGSRWKSGGERAFWPRISPDGQHVVYTWSSSDRGWHLRVVGMDESKPRIVYPREETHSAKEAIYPLVVGWLPDGRHVLASHSNQILLIPLADGPVQLLKTLSEEPVVNRPPRLCTMSLSPDGRYLAYSLAPKKDSGNRDIFLLPLDGKEETALLTHPADDYVLGWAPDGQRLLFAGQRNEAWDAWVIRVVDGKPKGTPQLVRPNIGQILPMGFTRNGSFYYELGVRRMMAVHTATLDWETGKVVEPPAPVEERALGASGEPTWSPDGKFLAYWSNDGVSQASVRISILSMQTGQVRQINPKLNWIASFRWSPDGRSFVAAAQPELGGPFGVFQIDARTGDAKTLVEPGEGASRPDWSPDGNGVFYVKGAGIRFRDLKTGSDKEILSPDRSGFDSVPVLMIDVSPDGQQVAVFGRESGAEAMVLKLIPANGGQARELLRLDKENKNRQPLSWTPDGRNLLLLRSHPEEARGLWKIPVDGGKPEKLELPWTDWLMDLSVHPDERRIAFTVDRRRKEEVWVMENFLLPLEDGN